MFNITPLLLIIGKSVILALMLEQIVVHLSSLVKKETTLNRFLIISWLVIDSAAFLWLTTAIMIFAAQGMSRMYEAIFTIGFALVIGVAIQGRNDRLFLRFVSAGALFVLAMLIQGVLWSWRGEQFVPPLFIYILQQIFVFPRAKALKIY